MRLYDVRRARVVDVVPRHRGRLAVRLAGTTPADGLRVDARFRAFLVADLLRRRAALDRLAVRVLPADTAVVGRWDGLDELADLNVHLAAVEPTGNDAPADVTVDVDTDEDRAAGATGVTTRAAVLGLPAAGGDAVPVASVARRGHDPLALRLAVLRHHYRRPLQLDWDAVGRAEEELARWRARVAAWAEHPSAAMPVSAVAAVEDAIGNDLDTPDALGALRDLEDDPRIAQGAKFEVFAHVDRLLGLDLARDVGRGPAHA